MTTDEARQKDEAEAFKVKAYGARMADVLSFSFDRVGWAIWMIDEMSGCVYVQSDWGDASYRWTTTALGAPTLKDFIVTAGDDDLVNKLCGEGSHGPFADCFDGKKTKEAIKKALLEYEHKNDEEEGTCDECCNDFEHKGDEFPIVLMKGFCDTCAEEMIDQFCRDGGNHSKGGGWIWALADNRLQKALQDGWETLEYEEHPWKKVHRERLIPALKEKLKSMGYGAVDRIRTSDVERASIRDSELKHMSIGQPVERRMQRWEDRGGG